jgi:2-furoate---CoA ligase
VTLARLLELAALRWPTAEAVVDGARRVTYADLHARATSLGAAFRGLGVAPGDRVLIALRNRLEHVLTYWALQTIGGVPTPVNFRFAPTEMHYVLQDSGARIALYEPDTAPAMETAARSRNTRLIFVGSGAVPTGSVSFADLLPADYSGVGGAVGPGQGSARPSASGSAEPCPGPTAPPASSGIGGDPARSTPTPVPCERDLSLILYTSGTTGRPKGVPRTHRNHHAGAIAQALQCGWTWGERTLGVMPLYHTMGVHALTGVAAVNGCFVCQPEWNATEALRLIRDERISALYLIPTLFYDLVHAPDFSRHAVDSVAKLAYAGAPMLAALTEACVKAFRPQAFVNHYGSTEIYTFSVRPDVHLKPGCAGRAGVHATLRVVRASTEERVRPHEVVPAGEKGEIIACLDSPEAFAGYWKRPDADTKALREGWYFTGDMGYVDADGELHVAGRVDDMIISGGENIHPIEVEEVLARHPGVRDVAVIGEADERWGQRVVAFVVPADPAVTAAALDAHCRSGGALAPFKRPRRVVFVAEIPKTASGKILRRLLRDGQYSEITP